MTPRETPKKPRRGTSPAVLYLTLTLAACAGCGESESTPSDADAAQPTPDAAPPTPDAAQPTPDAANQPPMPDAANQPPRPDAAIEPPMPDAAIQPPLPDAFAADARVLPDAAIEPPTPDAAIEPPVPDAAIQPPMPDAAVEPPVPDAFVPPPDPVPDPGLPPTPALVDAVAGVTCVVVDAVPWPAEPSAWNADCSLAGLYFWSYPPEWPAPLVPPGGIFRSVREQDHDGFGGVTTTWTEWRWDAAGELFRVAGVTEFIDQADPSATRTHGVDTTLCRIDATGRVDLSGFETGIAHVDPDTRRLVLDQGFQSAAARGYDAAGNVVRELSLDVDGPDALNPDTMLPVQADGPWPARDYHRGPGGRIEWVVDRLCRQDFPPVGLARTCDDVSFTHYVYDGRGALVGAEHGTPLGVDGRELVGGPCP
jgi:hypothetical protein